MFAAIRNAPIPADAAPGDTIRRWDVGSPELGSEKLWILL